MSLHECTCMHGLIHTHALSHSLEPACMCACVIGSTAGHPCLGHSARHGQRISAGVFTHRNKPRNARALICGVHLRLNVRAENAHMRTHCVRTVAHITAIVPYISFRAALRKGTRDDIWGVCTQHSVCASIHLHASYTHKLTGGCSKPWVWGVQHAVGQVLDPGTCVCVCVCVCVRERERENVCMCV